MKIAIVSSHTPSIFWFRMDMMNSFQKLGCEVIAIGNESESKWLEKFAENGIRYIQANITRNGTNPLNDILTFKSLYSILKAEKPDKVFTYQAKTVIYGGIAAHLLGIEEVYPLIAGFGSVFLQGGKKAKILQSILKAEYRIALKYAENIFFQNPDDEDFFITNKLTEKSKIVMINGSGVNLEKFTVLPLPGNASFLCISRLIRDKGVCEYLEAARIVKKQYPDIRFLLVGPFDTNPSAIKPEELEKYIKDGTIEYYGEQSDVRPYLEQCSVFVLPSYREGTPKTVLEAMACGRAVITTDAPGCRETVEDGENGALVPVKNVEVLANKMCELLNDPERVRKMGTIGRKMVEEKYDVKLVNAVICDTMKICDSKREL